MLEEKNEPASSTVMKVGLRLPSGMAAPVAQLDRVPDFGSGGWGFESLRAHFSKTMTTNNLGTP